MHITVICVGKIKEKFYTDALAEYQKRLSKYCKLDIVELADEKTKENASAHEVELVKAKEGERILSAIKEDMYVIALAIEGKCLTPWNFPRSLRIWAFQAAVMWHLSLAALWDWINAFWIVRT